MPIPVEKVGKLALISLTIREKEVLLEVIQKLKEDSFYDFLSFFLRRQLS